MNSSFRFGIVIMLIASVALGAYLQPVVNAVPSSATSADLVPVDTNMHDFMEGMFQAPYRRLKEAIAKEPKDNNTWRAALFGSMARGDATSESDIDIMIDLDSAHRMGIYEYVGLKEYISGLFDIPVDVVNREGLFPYVKPAATADAIYAF